MSKRARARRGPDGFVVVDKPDGMTSFKVMRAAARKLGGGKAGHAGTLDPAATGVLVVLLGEGTKLSRWVVGHDKAYRATIRFGVGTDTLDAEGKVTAKADVPPGSLTRQRLEAAFPPFIGDVEQLPPRYSAIKVDGRSLMSRARAGEDVPVQPRAVTCYALELVSVDGDEAVVDVSCGKGYYVRSLARDLGAALGLPAHLSALRRTRSGPFDIADAVALDALEPGHVRPLVDAAFDVPKIDATPDEVPFITSGRPVPAPEGTPVGARAILLAPDGAPLAMVERGEALEWVVVRGFRPAHDEDEDVD